MQDGHFEEWETFANGKKCGSQGDVESVLTSTQVMGAFICFSSFLSIFPPRVSQPLSGRQRRDEKWDKMKEPKMPKFGISPSLHLCLSGLSLSQLLQASVKQPELFFVFIVFVLVAAFNNNNKKKKTH